MEDVRESIGIEELLGSLGAVGILHPDADVTTGTSPQATLSTVFDCHSCDDYSERKPGQSLFHRADDSGLTRQTTDPSTFDCQPLPVYSSWNSEGGTHTGGQKHGALPEDRRIADGISTLLNDVVFELFARSVAIVAAVESVLADSEKDAT